MTCYALAMNAPERPSPADTEMRVLSAEPVNGQPHVFRITTESQRYGRVVQNVLLFPPEVFEERDGAMEPTE